MTTAGAGRVVVGPRVEQVGGGMNAGEVMLAALPVLVQLFWEDKGGSLARTRDMPAMDIMDK